MQKFLSFSTDLWGLQSYFQPSYTQTNQDAILLRRTIRERTYTAVVLLIVSQQ